MLCVLESGLAFVMEWWSRFVMVCGSASVMLLLMVSDLVFVKLYVSASGTEFQTVFGLRYESGSVTESDSGLLMVCV